MMENTERLKNLDIKGKNIEHRIASTGSYDLPECPNQVGISPLVEIQRRCADGSYSPERIPVLPRMLA